MIWRSALALASRKGTRGRLSILIFHRVLAQPDPILPGEPSATQFDALLQHVKSRFEVLRLHDAVGRLRSGTLPARALSITFDDGYADNLSVAAPLLRRHGIPATLFVATGYLDGHPMWNDVVIESFRNSQRRQLDLESLGLRAYRLDSVESRRAAIDSVLTDIKYLPPIRRRDLAEQIALIAGVTAPADLMLTSDALRTLPAYGVDVGAHTVSHPILARIPIDEAEQEIVQSKRDLEQIMGRDVSLFAYPNGQPGRDYTGDHVRMVRNAGFFGATSTSWGAASVGSDVFQLPRFTPWSREPLKFDLLMLRNLFQRVDQQAA